MEMENLWQLKFWLDDNVDQGTDIVFGEHKGVEIKSEALLRSLSLAMNALTKLNDCFVVLGRVADMDDILIFINAMDIECARQKFLELLKNEQHWDGKSDIYIEFCIPLSDYAVNDVYRNTDTSTIYALQNNEMQIDENGISNHLDDGFIDHDQNAVHVAIADES